MRRFFRRAAAFFFLAGSVAQAQLPKVVPLQLNAFPPAEIYQPTSRGDSYVGRTGKPNPVAPPMLDASGSSYNLGMLILRAPGHEDRVLQIPAQDWGKGKLPDGGGVYELVPHSPLIRIRDYFQVYPIQSSLTVLLLLGGAVAGFRWRRRWAAQRNENRRLSERLRSTGDPLIGRNLGSYVVGARLGQGGMGSVYKVHDPEGNLFAAKVLYFSDVEEQQLRRFRREFKVISKLQHPSLVRGFDYGEEEGLAYCIMELVTGKTLDRYVVAGGLPWSTIWPWVRGVLEGLHCAHGNGVVHRDLKPSNIIVNGNAVKILDFGLARHQEITAVTLTGEAFGTPCYIAPEQISSPGSEVEPRTDLYSLGIILFELLTGKPPFDGEDVRDVLAQHLSAQPPRLSQVVTGNPAELDVVLSTLLAKSPANRYPNAERVLNVLKELEFGRPSMSADTVGVTKPPPPTVAFPRPESGEKKP